MNLNMFCVLLLSIILSASFSYIESQIIYFEDDPDTTSHLKKGYNYVTETKTHKDYTTVTTWSDMAGTDAVFASPGPGAALLGSRDVRQMDDLSTPNVSKSIIPRKDYSDGTSKFRKDYNYVMETGTYYKEHRISRTWFDAVAICKAEGAELATPLTEKDAQVLALQTTDNTWLGIHDLLAEGTFITLKGASIADIYTNWRSGEPNNAGEGEDCVVMYKDGVYNDDVCTKKFKFVCTKHQSEVKTRNTCETTDTGYFYQMEGDRCYKLHTTPKNWHEAFAICHYEEASLAVINFQREADLFIENLVRYPEHTLRGSFNKSIVLLGFSDLISPGEFLTINGQNLEDLDYNEWADGQPDNWQGKEHCGSMLRNGKLNDVACDVKAYFFCEKVLREGTVSRLIMDRFNIDSGIEATTS